MSDQLIRLLAFGVIVLLYLFFFRVLRAVWAGVAAPRNQSSWKSLLAFRGDGREDGVVVAQPVALVVRSPLDAQGRRHLLGDALTIGRSEECDVVIDDSYSSTEHARLYRRGGQHLLEDLGSTNGTYLNRQKVATTSVVRLGDYVQVGSTVFEVST
ncbi:FHA domain-containing protein [Candidatus Poriferisodalis sp.]|uniref:FHA domain-containing protein n=1 Tax=Candidatus Poriferisodalis sp. TaxID=3101277 RepID=UPI003D1041C5